VDILDLIIVGVLILSIVINIIILMKLSKGNNSEDHIISELKINLGQNNFNLMDSIPKKIWSNKKKF